MNFLPTARQDISEAVARALLAANILTLLAGFVFGFYWMPQTREILLVCLIIGVVSLAILYPLKLSKGPLFYSYISLSIMNILFSLSCPSIVA
jgi:hypothetical protein